MDELSWDKSENFSQHDFLASDLESDINEEQNDPFHRVGRPRVNFDSDAGCATLAFAR